MSNDGKGNIEKTWTQGKGVELGSSRNIWARVRGEADQELYAILFFSFLFLSVLLFGFIHQGFPFQTLVIGLFIFYYDIYHLGYILEFEAFHILSHL